jgi:glucose/arabinose dehydrogenase
MGGGAALAAQTNAPDAPKTKVTVTTVTDKLSHPWGLQVLPDGRYLVTERDGALRVVSQQGAVTAPIDGMPNVVNKGQGGLLDVLLAPDYATSGTIFFSYAEPRGNFRNGTTVVRAKLTLEGQSGRVEDGQIIFRQEPAATSFQHFGSRLLFDNTGALLITTGERGSLSEMSQDLGTHLGKVIRIMPDGSVPPDNPFVKDDDKRPEVWSYGHRNMQGAAYDSATGTLWVTEHGPRGGDELNRVEKGKNYGWPVITYGIEYSGGKVGDGITAKEGMEQPVYYWKPSIGTSGLALYTGGLFKDWEGNLLAGGLAKPRLERLVLKDGAVAAKEVLLSDLRERVRDVRVAPDGAVLVLTDGDSGKLLRLTPAP